MHVESKVLAHRSAVNTIHVDQGFVPKQSLMDGQIREIHHQFFQTWPMAQKGKDKIVMSGLPLIDDKNFMKTTEIALEWQKLILSDRKWYEKDRNPFPSDIFSLTFLWIIKVVMNIILEFLNYFLFQDLERVCRL